MMSLHIPLDLRVLQGAGNKVELVDSEKGSHLSLLLL
jgi:hypothetical protein